MRSSESDIALMGGVATVAALAAGILGVIATTMGLTSHSYAGGPTSS